MNMKYLVASFVLVTAPLLSVPATGMPSDSLPSSNVNLVATLHGGPAFSPVRWSVYRLDNGVTPVPVKMFDHRHSLAIPLPPGRYRADASLHNVTRSRTFDVSTFVSTDIVVALD
jgi:hypothetical protein